jgi:hypothetical protein
MNRKKLLSTIVFCFVSLNFVQSQTFNFDDNTLMDTTGTVSLVPFNIFGSGQIPAPASGTLDTSEGKLRLSATHFGNGTAFDPTILGTILGPTRIGVVNPTPYQDFKVSILITDTGSLADTESNPLVLLGARLTDVGPGTTKGYGIALSADINGQPSIVLYKIVNENTIIMKREDGSEYAFGVSNLSKQSQILLTFTGVGPVLTVDTDDLTTDVPGYSFSATDTEYTAGVSGVIVAAFNPNPEQSVTAAIDNFTSGPAPILPAAPELTIAQSVKLTWPMMEGNFQLESSPSLNYVWRKVETQVFEVDGMLQATVVVDAENSYFRLRPIE